MSEEKNKLDSQRDVIDCDKPRPIIDNSTLIPIGFVFSICAAVWFFSALNTRMNVVEENVSDIQESMKQIATINETLSAMNVKIDNLNEYLSNYDIKLSN